MKLKKITRRNLEKQMRIGNSIREVIKHNYAGSKNVRVKA